MKKVVLMVMVLVTSFMAVGFAATKAKDIQFRLVLSDDEAKSTASKKYSYASRQGQAPKEITVSNNALLSAGDIESMIVVRKEDTRLKDYPMVDIVFNKEGSQKLADISEKNLRRSIAVVIGDEVLTAPYIIYPLTRGHFMLSNWKIDTDESARKLISDMGFTPLFKEDLKNIK